MQAIRYIEDQITALRAAGLSPKYLALSVDIYQELMKHVARDAGADVVEPQREYLGCRIVLSTDPNIIEVSIDPLEYWERSDEYLKAKAFT